MRAACLSDMARSGGKQSRVSEWLSGKAKPGCDLLRDMALVYGVSADYFLGFKDTFS